MESSDDCLARRSDPLHVVLFPFMATGHMPPMVDMANLFAARGGVAATVVATPANAPLVVSRRLPGPAAANVALRTLPFPSPALTGLPPGVENVADLSDPDSVDRFMVAVRRLREPFRRLLREMSPVDAVVADFFFPWTIPDAEELGIPLLVFHGTGFFALCAKAAAPVGVDGDTVVLDGLPHRVAMLCSQMQDAGKLPAAFRELLDEIAATERRSYGTVVNSFYELEPDYVRHYREAMGRRAWHVGPMALLSRDGALLQRRLRPNEKKEDEEAQQGREQRAQEPTGSDSDLLEWLDRNRPDSVLYVCFGSMGRLGAAQLGQFALGLEASCCPFIWVVRDSDNNDNDAEWLPHEWKKRVEGRGLVLNGWAPQKLILGHPSVGGFVTHCGWNSCLEAVCAGVPMVTWPLYAEQFVNERLLADVLRIGAPVGATKFALVAEERPVIAGAQIEAAIRRAMGGGEAAAAAEMRRRARELAEAARRAVEPGGSSYVDLANLIQELTDRRSRGS